LRLSSENSGDGGASSPGLIRVAATDFLGQATAFCFVGGLLDKATALSFTKVGCFHSSRTKTFEPTKASLQYADQEFRSVATQIVAPELLLVSKQAIIIGWSLGALMTTACVSLAEACGNQILAAVALDPRTVPLRPLLPQIWIRDDVGTMGTLTSIIWRNQDIPRSRADVAAIDFNLRSERYEKSLDTNDEVIAHRRAQFLRNIEASRMSQAEHSSMGVVMAWDISKHLQLLMRERAPRSRKPK